VLIERRVDDDPDAVAVGRTEGQASDVDGVTHLVGLEGAAPGEIVEVEIVDALEHDLVGRVVAR
jgi:ribosomal protein S12 methylthiotransferase